MNKKGIIAIVVIVLIVIGYMIWGGKSAAPVVEQKGTESGTSSAPISVTPSGANKNAYAPVTKASTDTSLLGRLKSASVSVTEDGSRVALSDGKASFSNEAGKGSVTLGDIAIETSSSGTKFALATLAVNLGGSGTFQYVVLFEDNNGTLTDKSYVLIGDRVSITGLRADEVAAADGSRSYAVSVSYLDRKAGEPMATKPSVAHTKIEVVENGVFNLAKEITL